MTKNTKNSLIYTALSYLGETSKGLLDLSYNVIFDPKKIIFKQSYAGYSQQQFSKKMYNLKRSPYFSFKNDKLYLTEKGRIEIIKNVVKNKKELKNWDGLWRAIIFDMPESKRRERNFLRNELKWMGFKELQHSIWLTPYDIKDEIIALLKLWHKDFKGDIKFLEIDKIIEDTDIRKSFGL